MSKHQVIFHGKFKESYCDQPVSFSADSMTMLMRLIFKSAFPSFIKNEDHFSIVIEDESGNFTEIYDPEQALPLSNCKVHILPSTDGAYVYEIIAIVIAIIAVGVALLLAPKLDMNKDTASGANWESPENVIGQGGVTPVLLGTRLVGSRVVSHGIDSSLYVK
jgi:hypothetical protein